MRYAELRRKAGIGDVLLVSGDDAMSRLLRAATASQYSHIAVLVWLEGGLWVSEVKPKTGYTLTHASKRIPQMLAQGTVRWGAAPIVVARRLMLRAVTRYRDGAGDDALDPGYSYWSGLTVWLSQLTGYALPHRMICSTYAQEVWEAGGLTFDGPADPEDFEHRIEKLVRIDGDADSSMEVYEEI